MTSRTIGILCLIGNLLAEVLHAGCDVSASCLCVQGLAAVLAQPLRERLPRALDVVRYALATGVLEDGQVIEILESYLWVPELSLSRYLCTSKIRFLVVPSGLVTVRRAGPDPLETKVCAEV